MIFKSAARAEKEFLSLIDFCEYMKVTFLNIINLKGGAQW
jgi:hypothetical protein